MNALVITLAFFGAQAVLGLLGGLGLAVYELTRTDEHSKTENSP